MIRQVDLLRKVPQSLAKLRKNVNHKSELSAILRRLRVGDYIHWLPGVRQDPGNDMNLLVNTQIAHWFQTKIRIEITTVKNLR